MKAARTPGAIILLATCWMLGGASRAEESTALDRFNRAQEILGGLEAEGLIERAIFRDELDRGLSRKAWSIREKDEALEQMRSAFHLPEDGQPRPAAASPAWYSMSEARGILTSGDPSRPTAPLLDWLGQRVGALREVRNDARRALRTAALDYAEETWLTARAPADLAPAIPLLNEARLSFDRLWGMVDQARGSGRSKMPYEYPTARGMASLREAVDVYDFLSVLMSPEPFFLPDPADDPAGFAAGRALWPDLVSIGHAFTLRPAIAARFQRHDVIYRNLLFTTGQRLNNLIEHNATAAEYEPPYLQWRALATPPSPRHHPALGKVGDIYRIDDYHNFDARIQPSQGQRPIRPPPPQATAYFAWLTLRQAEENGDPAKIREARVALLRERATLPSSTSDYLAARDRTDTNIPPNAAEEAAKPVDALIARLRRFLSQKNDGGAGDAKALLAMWEALRDETARPPSDTDPSPADHWAAFSMHSGSRTLFTLRDRAARQLLTGLYPAEPALASSTTPLVTELRDRLTAAITGGTADLAEKLLALDAAGTFLLPAEHQAWARDAAILREAAALLAAGERDSARATYTRAIRQLTDPSLGEFAARQARVLKSSPIK